MVVRQAAGRGGAVKGVAAAAFLCAALGFSANAVGGGVIAHMGFEAGTAKSLAPEVERLVERSKPSDWALRRACLYYAFAGQRLLARHGVRASVRVGAVVYDPGTVASHQIWPHAWLETGTHFIDYSALPRWGMVRLVPLQRVARRPSDVRPGGTGVLVLRRLEDPELAAYLAFHRGHFDRIVEGADAQR